MIPDMDAEKYEDMKVSLEDYKKTGNPDLLNKLRRYIFQFQDYEGDDPVVLDLKQTFHF